MQARLVRLLVLLAACIIGGLAAGLSGSAVVTALMLVDGYKAAGDIISGYFVFAVIVSIFGWVAAIVFGLPAHAALTRHAPGWAAYTIAGIAAGSLLSLMVAANDLRFILIGVIAGGIGGLAFWAVARPDRLRNRDVNTSPHQTHA